MEKRMTDREMDMLQLLAEHRMLTVPQLMDLLSTSDQMVRRHIRILTGTGLVTSSPRGLARVRGRPEQILSLTTVGVNALKEAERLPSDVKPGQATAEGLSHEVDHQLLLNWIAIRCNDPSRANPALAVTLLSSKSPYHRGESGGTLLTETIIQQDGESVVFVPDAVFAIAHTQRQKSLLFFLEVDMGTETAASPGRASRKDVRTKITLYRKYFAGKGYKRYERRFGAELNGFRLLFVASSIAGRDTLCRLVQEMQPSDFVWVTDQGALFKEGIGGRIWARGGTETGQSILGSADGQVEGKAEVYDGKKT
jgi:DNA-binding transcriptional ArsR family regulator